MIPSPFATQTARAAILRWALVNEARLLSYEDEPENEAEAEYEFSLLCRCEEIIATAIQFPVGEA